MGDEDFLAAVEADNASAPVEGPKEPVAAPETPAAEPPKEPEPADKPRDEHGKFKAKVPEAPPEPQAAAVEPTPAPAPPAQPEPGFVPIAAMLDARDKAKAEAERATQAEAELQRLRAAQQPAEVPDPANDPIGYARHQQAELQNALLNQTLNFSERLARKDHGSEVVDAAQAWAKQKLASDPLYVQQIYSDADPYGRLVTDYKREQLFSQVTDPSEIDEFRAWKAAKGQLAQQQAAPAAEAPLAPAIPPRSLASAPSAGDVLTQPVLSDEEAFAEAFPKRNE